MIVMQSIRMRMRARVCVCVCVCVYQPPLPALLFFSALVA